jgi:hypothetical protein
MKSSKNSSRMLVCVPKKLKKRNPRHLKPMKLFRRRNKLILESKRS